MGGKTGGSGETGEASLRVRAWDARGGRRPALRVEGGGDVLASW